MTILNLSNLTPFLPPRALPLHFSCSIYHLLPSLASCYLVCINHFCLARHWVLWNREAYHSPELFPWIILFNLPRTGSARFIARYSIMRHSCSIMQLILHSLRIWICLIFRCILWKPLKKMLTIVYPQVHTSLLKLLIFHLTFRTVFLFHTKWTLQTVLLTLRNYESLMIYAHTN